MSSQGSVSGSNPTSQPHSSSASQVAGGGNFSGSSSVVTTTTNNSGGANCTVVAYYFCGEQIPYRTVVQSKVITLSDFKSLLTRKGNYRLIFKTFRWQYLKQMIRKSVPTYFLVLNHLKNFFLQSNHINAHLLAPFFFSPKANQIASVPVQNQFNIICWLKEGIFQFSVKGGEIFFVNRGKISNYRY